MKDEKIRVFMVRPDGGDGWMYVESLSYLDDMIEADGGYEIHLVHMTREQIDALPEFDGW